MPEHFLRPHLATWRRPLGADLPLPSMLDEASDKRCKQYGLWLDGRSWTITAKVAFSLTRSKDVNFTSALDSYLVASTRLRDTRAAALERGERRVSG
jgi:hypothetical protein